ncbi:MAG: pyridoxal phosphate-dependent aminotransferase [Candidatus Dormibacteria bacterium]
MTRDGSHLRPGLAGARAYSPGEQPADGGDWIKLNTNEAPCGPSPRALEAARAAASDLLRLYPDPRAERVREEWARVHGVTPGQVLVANGADEVLRLAFSAFLDPGDEVATPWPTYSLLAPLARLQGARLVPFQRNPADPGVPAGFAESAAPLKVLTNPNSPTGAWLPPEVVSAVCRSSPGVVLVDEAYVDFAPSDCTRLLATCPNLLLVRTLSKSYALAGLRVGLAMGSVDLVGALDLVRDSYPVDRVTAAAAAAAIADQEHHQRLVAMVRGGRATLAAGLAGLGFEVLPSEANFLLCRPGPGSPHPGAAAVFRLLREHRILVRFFDLEPGGPWLRVTVGTPDQHSALLEVLGG